uniref:Aminotransferase-like plant mobile domain-containing protein n=1 Tax=Fagus sylvatica TaxID=28930 RepID=A0A2N9IJU5_FAGSY
MQHISGKLSTSSFQRYKVCANRSSDERVMAPGSRGVGAVFVHFSGEDSDQTGDAIGEPRVPRRSWSRYLSNAPGLADQLVASRKDSAREGGSPDVRFRRSWYRWKACAAYFCKVPDLRKSELGLVRYGPANRGHRSVFGPFEGSFPIGIPASPDQLVASQEDSARKRGNVGGKIPELSAKPYFVGLFSRAWPCTEASLGSQDMILRTGGRRNVPYAKGFDHNSLVSRPFSARKVSNRSSHHVLQNGPGAGLRLTRRFRLRALRDSDRRSVFAYTSYRDGLAWVTTQVSNRGRIGLGDHPGLETKFVIWVRIGLGDHPGLETEFGLGDHPGLETKWVRIGLGDHPGLETETNRGRIGLGDHPGLETKFVIRVRIGLGDHPGLETKFVIRMSDRGSGSGGPRRSDHLAKGKAVLYEPDSPPDTDDEYDAMEDTLPVRLVSPAAAPPVAPPARSKRRRSDRAPLSADPIPEDYVAPGFRYPPQGGIRPRYPVTTPVVDTSLLTGLHSHPSSSVRRCEDPPESIGRGGWSEFCQLLEIARPEYRDFLVELGFGPFLSKSATCMYGIPLVRCWVERFFHHTGTIHLRFLLANPVSDFEALEILGIDDPAAVVGKKLFYLKISYLRDLLVREIEEPPTELRYRQWTAYFIFSCFLGNDKSTIPTPIVGMFRDIDDLRDYDWGALTYGFYIRGLRRFSRRETASFLGFWQFTLFWAFEHFAVFAPSRLPAALDSIFPLARRWDSAWIQRLTVRTLTECRTTVDCIRDADIVFQPYSTFLLERLEVFRAMELSRLRIWIRSPRSWELLMGERTLRQLGGDALVPVDPPQLMTIEDYIPRAPSDSFVAGVEVEGGRVMGGSAMDSHLFQSSGEFERLQTEILRLQLELSVSEDRYIADMDRAQEETARVQVELTQVQGELTQVQGGLDPERLEDQLHGMGITPVTGAGSSGLGQTSSSPPPDPVSRDWFFDDPPSL